MDVRVSMSHYPHALPEANIFYISSNPSTDVLTLLCFSELENHCQTKSNLFISDKFHCIDPNNQIDKLIHLYAVDSVRTFLIDKKRDIARNKKQTLIAIYFH